MNIPKPKTKMAYGLILAGILIAAIDSAILISPHISRADAQPGNGASRSASGYKQMLKDQVDTPLGSPREGRDPSKQAQASLAQAASSPDGTGVRTDKPASGISGTKSNRRTTKPSDIYGDPSVTGINSAGCFVNYGKPGQCVPASLGDQSMGGMLMCNAVRSKFPHGVVVNGEDRFGLDRNHDGTACGRND